jgi:2-dehydrotetronate isomerase
VECHWPYDTPAQIVADVLAETGLAMLSLNTARGDVARGENGLAALPGREAEARAAIDQAVEYASSIKATNVHVMAGKAQGKAAHETFVNNLHYATLSAKPFDITILIEPLNHFDVPHYFLQTSEQAAAIISEVVAPNLKLLFDCYHIQLMEGNLSRRLRALKDIIGHVQIASVPDRAEPHDGEVNYRFILQQLRDIGYTAPIGAEYKPSTTTKENLAWLSLLR